MSSGSRSRGTVLLCGSFADPIRPHTAEVLVGEETNAPCEHRLAQRGKTKAYSLHPNPLRLKRSSE